MSRQIRVMIVDNSLGTTGAIKSIALNAADLRDRFEFIFVLPQGSANRSWLEHGGFRVFELPFLELRKSVSSLFSYLPRLWSNAAALRSLIQDQQINVVHCNDLYNLTPTLARCGGGSFALITHVRLLRASMPSLLYRLWSSIHVRCSNAIVCNSTATMASFEEAPQAQLIANRHPAEEQLPAPKILPRSPLRVLYLGNYMVGKGQDLALAAFADAIDKQPGLELHFVGGYLGLEKNRQYRRQLEARVRALGLTESVFFHGPTSDVEATMKDHDIALNCSPTESFSRVCQEALYFGLPLISTDSGGPADQITDGENGLLVDPPSVENIGDALVRLAADEPLRRRFSSIARERCRHQFGPEHTSEKLADLYRKLSRAPAAEQAAN